MQTAPASTSAAVRRSMQGNRRRDTAPEIRVRRQLHGLGLRYRVDAPLPLEGHRPIRADVVFRQARVAVFIDGCFWHGCPEHYSKPRSNTEYWTPKIERNQRRDELANRLLTISGWKVIRAWEHEDPSDVAFEIASVVWSRVAAGTG